MAESNRVDQGGVVARTPRDSDGLGCHRKAFVEVGVPGGLDAQHRQQARPVGTIRVTEPGERALQHVDAFVVDPANDAVPASVVPQRRPHEDVDRVDVVGEAARREQGLAVLGITRLSLRVAEPEEQLGPSARIGGGSPVEQIERVRIPVHCLVGCELGQGPIARLLRVR